MFIKNKETDEIKEITNKEVAERYLRYPDKFEETDEIKEMTNKEESNEEVGKPINKMNKEELINHLKSLGITNFSDEMTKAELIKLIPVKVEE